MKKILLVITGFFVFITGHGQNISKITIAADGSLSTISFGLDERVQVQLTRDGHISNWGFDKYIGYEENYMDQLEPYVGRTEYYTQNDDEALRGKVKYIGKTLLSYYPSYEKEELRGKLKSIGPYILDYYLTYDDKAYAGNIKSIGRQNITWYASFDNEMLRGKLKSVGPTLLSYYGSFEDRSYRGKIKSIDRFNITYYSSFEQYSGAVKSGSNVLIANGIKYFVRNY